MSDENDRIRLDKWLWAARFFKTRSLATQACEGGKVHVDGQRAKPSMAMRLGLQISLRQGFDDKVIVVRALSVQRGNAASAQQLYEETPDSIAKRELHAAQHQAMRLATPLSDGRPDKKQRRQLRQLHNDFLDD